MPKETKLERHHNKPTPTSSTKKSLATSYSNKPDADVTSAVVEPSTVGKQTPDTSPDERQPEKHGTSTKTSAAGAVSSKRRHDGESDAELPSSKRLKKAKRKKQPQSRPRIRKLAAPRPFPTVPTSVSATGPRSAHTEGKNRICITRKTELGMYLRRCKDVVLKDGYKTLYLHAMGAAIPHLARLAVSLPSILPFAESDIQTEVRTGTTEVQDEIIPDDEDEDIVLRTRGKSTMSVTIKIEGGDERKTKPTTNERAKREGKAKKDGESIIGKDKDRPDQLVFTEADLEDDESLS